MAIGVRLEAELAIIARTGDLRAELLKYSAKKCSEAHCYLVKRALMEGDLDLSEQNLAEIERAFPAPVRRQPLEMQ